MKGGIHHSETNGILQASESLIPEKRVPYPQARCAAIVSYANKFHGTKHFRELLLLFGFIQFALFTIQIDPFAAWAAAESSKHPKIAGIENQHGLSEPWHRKIEAQWGGQVKAQGFVSHVDDQSLFQPVGTGTYYDGNAEFRLKSAIFFGQWGHFETDYEAVLLGGDTRSKGKELVRLFPDLVEDGLLLRSPIADDRRFLNLTKTVAADDDYILYHRLDRLFLTLLPKWGTARIGRQAVTWGNGLLFNPMDLFNPFSPTDIERDYKVGDDIATIQFSANGIGDFQFLYVPRRETSDGHVAWDESSLAGKLHFALDTTELDIMAAKHFQDVVIGFGSTGYLGGAAWRLDATWTFLDEDSESDDYLTLVANMDYSWVWWEKNFYGFIEFFYNGLGEEEYTQAFVNPDIVERLKRGELFVLGRRYLSGHIRVELHPLFNVFFTVINNLADPSGILQPRAIWDITQDVQLTFGGNVFYGAKDTEFGGFRIPDTDLLNKPSDSGFLWLTYFF